MVFKTISRQSGSFKPHTGFLLFMGRHRKNKFEEATIAYEKGTEFEQNHVKIPFFVNVTYKVPILEEKNGKKHYGITTNLLKKDISEKDAIIKAFQKEGKKVINIEEFTIPFSDLCPNCNRKGVPKVERKSNKIDYHARVRDTFTEPPKHTVKTNRPDEYWLTFDHDTKPKKCRIAQWDKNHFLFKKKGKAYAELLKYTMPFYVEWQQHGTVIA